MAQFVAREIFPLHWYKKSAGISRPIFLFTVLSGFSSCLYGLHRELVNHRSFGCHEVKEGSGKREECCDRECHYIPVDEEINGKPYLESDGEQSCNHAHPGLKEECLEAGRSCNMRCYEHDEQGQVRQLFAVSDGRFRAVRTYYGREGAEEHRKYKCGRNAEV